MGERLLNLKAFDVDTLRQMHRSTSHLELKGFDQKVTALAATKEMVNEEPGAYPDREAALSDEEKWHFPITDELLGALAQGRFVVDHAIIETDEG